MITVLSYGAGQDTWAILLELINNKNAYAKYVQGTLIVVMSDTGNEHKETYDHVKNFVRPFCQLHNIPFFFLEANGQHHGSWGSLIDFYNRTKTVGSKAFPKSCTDNLKIQPIYKFLNDYVSEKYGYISKRKGGLGSYKMEHGKMRVIIGIAKGEESRAGGSDTGPLWMQRNIEKVYPLIDLGIDRKKCQEIITSYSQPIPLPSNCILCPYMNDVELLWLYRFQPHWYKTWVEIENNKIQNNLHKGEKNLGVWGKKLLPEKLQEVIAKHGHMSNDDLQEYKMSHGHCVKSKY